MTHLTEEELIEHYYSKGEGTANRHLEECAECAEAYAALQSDLAQMMPAEPPTRDASYGEQVWTSIAFTLPVYHSSQKHWMRIGLWRGLSYAAVCGLLLAGAFFAGRHWEQERRRSTAENNPAQARQRVILVVLGDHLDRTERLLVELKHADAGSTEMVSPLRDEARSLLAANGACRQDAAQIGDPALSTALERLNPLLSELANQPDPDSMNHTTLARLQKEINANGLLFEVRVLRSRIPDHKSAATAQLNGGTI
jgi:hypothetical protein